MADKYILEKALRCSCTPGNVVKCEGCEYRGLDEWKEDFPCQPDLEIEGKKYLEYCDCEKMSLDAADLLESFGWIDAEFEVPENDRLVLIHFANDYLESRIHIGKYVGNAEDGGAFYFSTGEESDIPLIKLGFVIDYWMNIPEVPNGN